MTLAELKDKVYRKSHHILWGKIKPGDWILNMYPTFRHWKKVSKSGRAVTGDKSTLYLSQKPNKGAGIGHQMGNWNCGYYYSQYFGVNYAYSTFSNPKWDSFLGFGENEICIEDLVAKGYQVKQLPYFYEKEKETLLRTQQIIDSYAGEKVVFLLELDQFYAAQYGAMEHIKEKFYSASARKDEALEYDPSKFNIAVHIRRGDIVIGQENKDPSLTKRWIDNTYYASLLQDVIEQIPNDKPYEIYVFSQGKEEDFKELAGFEHLRFCFDMNAQKSFLHMVYADVLLTSKSSFSYKPALLSNGIKLVPDHFWHGYPENESWIVVDGNGKLTEKQKEQLCSLL